MQLPFLGLLISLFITTDISDTIILGVEIYSIILCVISLLIAFLSIILALLNLTKEVPCPYKTTLAIKLTLIPFYVINFLIWAIFVVGTLNPFFFVFLPLILGFSIVSTYLIMLSTSAQNIVYLLRQFVIQKKLSYLGYAICHFIFCVDVIAAVMVYINHKPLPNHDNVIDI
jgi:hypothetical protein